MSKRIFLIYLGATMLMLPVFYIFVNQICPFQSCSLWFFVVFIVMWIWGVIGVALVAVHSGFLKLDRKNLTIYAATVVGFDCLLSAFWWRKESIGLFVIAVLLLTTRYLTKKFDFAQKTYFFTLL